MAVGVSEAINEIISEKHLSKNGPKTTRDLKVTRGDTERLNLTNYFLGRGTIS